MAIATKYLLAFKYTHSLRVMSVQFLGWNDGGFFQFIEAILALSCVGWYWAVRTTSGLKKMSPYSRLSSTNSTENKIVR